MTLTINQPAVGMAEPLSVSRNKLKARSINHARERKMTHKFLAWTLLAAILAAGAIGLSRLALANPSDRGERRSDLCRFG